MRICFDNVDFRSRSGPNSFALKLGIALSKLGHVLAGPHEHPDVQLSFIRSINMFRPMVQRLDGIWFNVAQDWKAMNEPILRTFQAAQAVVYQSDFDRELCERFFGHHDVGVVIRNGTDVEKVLIIDPMSVPSLKGVKHVWTCASAWRPHKRLAENVRYFLDHAEDDDCMVIAGSNPDYRIAHPRVFYAGDLMYEQLLSLFRATDYFVHLAYLDHCPNVVVDARAAGAKIICSSSGGTKEVAGKDAIIIEEDPWDFEPCDLYRPPALDFSKKVPNDYDCEIDINATVIDYDRVLTEVI